MHGNYQFGTYDLNDDAPNESSLIPYEVLEGHWKYVYMGYRRSIQLANCFTYDGIEQVLNAKNVDLLHKPLGDHIKFIIGGEANVPGFQGVLTEIALHFGPGSYLAQGIDIKKSVDNSYALRPELTIEHIHKQKHGVQELIGDVEKVGGVVGGNELSGDTWAGVGEYSISGWFKITDVTEARKEGEDSSPCQILFRVANSIGDQLTDRKS